MAAAQTLPNIPTNTPYWQSLNQQSNNPTDSIEVIQVRLTSAQLLGLRASPVNIVLSPGGNGLQTYYINSIALKYDFVTTAYTLNAGTFKLFYGLPSLAHALTADMSTNFLTAAGDRYIVNIPTLVVAADTAANILNKGIWAGNDGAAAYTLGDGVVDVTIAFGRTTP